MFVALMYNKLSLQVTVVDFTWSMFSMTVPTEFTSDMFSTSYATIIVEVVGDKFSVAVTYRFSFKSTMMVLDNGYL